MNNVNENQPQIYTCTAVAFELGQIVMTQGVSQLLGDLPYELLLLPCLARHTNGDWGELCIEDKVANDEATRHGLRILSAYRFGDERIWVITEGDRSVTTFLLPSEY
ncbi:type I restriction endonuclease subunit M [Vibrio jasicida]|uniref:type I restriction endonuclease subunit M n=1 Tax=Vibrio jasicida TaxID=766224 RepID=UPI0040695842